MKKPNKLKVGSILVSGPLLEGEYFHRSVILILDYDNKGTMGIVLNKVLEVDINQVVPSLSCKPFLMNSGGPIAENRIFFLHNIPGVISDSQEIGHGVYWGGQEDDIKKYFSDLSFDEQRMKAYIGYTGWDVGQLEEEIKQGSWTVLNGCSDLFFYLNPDEMWVKMVEKLDKKFHLWLRFPKDSMMN